MKKFISLSIALYSLHLLCMPIFLYSCESEKETCDNPTATKRARFQKEHMSRDFGKSEVAAEVAAEVSAPVEFTARPKILLPPKESLNVITPSVFATKDSAHSPREYFKPAPLLTDIIVRETSEFPSLGSTETKKIFIRVTPLLRGEKPLIHKISSITKSVDTAIDEDDTSFEADEGLDFEGFLKYARPVNKIKTHTGTLTRVLCGLKYSDDTVESVKFLEPWIRIPHHIKLPIFKGEIPTVEPVHLS